MMERTKKPKKDVILTQEQFHVMTSLAGRGQLGQVLGRQYDGNRDIYQALGYPENITFADYAGRYSRQDMAKAVIDRPIAYTWKGPLMITDIKEEKKKNDTLEKAWTELQEDLQLENKFVRLDKVSSIGSYGVLLMGFDDTKMPTDFAKPVEKGERKLLYVKPLAEEHSKIASYVTDPKDKRYGMPLTYDVQFVSEVGTSLSNSTTEGDINLLVHYTRVIHVVEEKLESETHGVPALEAVYNRLMDLEKLNGGSAEMYWRGARPGYQGKVDKEFQMTDAVWDKLQTQYDEYENNLRRILINEGVDMEALEMQVSDPTNHVDVQIQMISAVTGIPKRILTGSERGELASSQDRDAWFDVVQMRREEHAEPNIVRAFVDVCMEYGVLPEADKYMVIWADLYAPSEKEKADVGRIRAEALSKYESNPVISGLMPFPVFLEFFLGFTEDQIQQVNEITAAGPAQEQNQIDDKSETEV